MPGLHTIVYVSHAAIELHDTDLELLLATSRRNNARDGITGVLLHRDGNFMQCLEGEPEAVRRTFARIERDPRHAGVIVLLDEPITERSFSRHSLGHLQPTRSDLLALSTEGWRDEASSASRTSRGLAALRSFAQRDRHAG